MINTVFQISGTQASDNDFLNSNVSGLHNVSLHDFKNMLGIPSGPGFEDDLSELIKFNVSSSEMLIGGMSMRLS